jgi:ATP-binding protein involved in chromosome partitioning
MALLLHGDKMPSEADPITLVEPAATRVRDPVSGRSMWLAQMIRHPVLRGENLHFDVVFQAEHSPEDRRAMMEAVEANLRGLGFEGKVKALAAGAVPGAAKSRTSVPPQIGRKPDPVPGMSGPGVGPHGGPIQKKRLEGVKHIIAVASGKGGVGKSTVATNLAVGLQRLGHKVGLMDADIYGPSLPLMMNTSQRPMVDRERQRILPVMSFGVRCMSMGLLMEADQAMIWRGPMVQGAVRQLLQEADWHDIDYLIVDLPPGTGDAQLTLIQAVTLSGAVIVTTPQDVALADAERGITMFRKLDVPLLGLVENMAWYELPDGTRDYVFGEGGGRRCAEAHKTPLLGQIPLRTTLRQSGDDGLPVVLGEGATADIFLDICRQVAASVPVVE